VDLPHLDAGLALWQYSADTHRYLFASGAGRSPLADKLLGALHAAGPAGLSRTDIRRASGSNAKTTPTIDAALQELGERGLAIPDKVATAGRPSERWRHVYFLNAAAYEGKEGREEREESSDGRPDAGGFSPIAPFPPSSQRPADTADRGGDPPLAPGWLRFGRKDGTALDVPAATIPGGRRITWMDGGEDVLPPGSGDADPEFLETLADEHARVDVVDDLP
jgi:hypothetical protein